MHRRPKAPQRSEIRFSKTPNTYAFSARTMGGSGPTDLSGPTATGPFGSLRHALFWASLLSTFGSTTPTGIQAPQTVNHVPFQQVGHISPFAQTALLSFHIDVTNIKFALLNLLNSTTEPEERKIITGWQHTISEKLHFLSTTTRPRRSILTWIASITGLFNHLRINQVNSKIHNVKQASELLNSETEQIFHHIKATDANFENLASILRKDEKTLWQFDLLLRQEKQWRNAERAITAVSRIIDLLPQHKLAPDAFFIFDIEREWKRLQDKVQKRGKELAMPSWQYILHCHTSYWTDTNSILIAIEVPIKDREGSSYDLFQYHKSPFLIDNKLYRAQTWHEFLAVHAVTKATFALTRAQLNKFTTKVLDTWYFHGPIIENHGDQKECIEALWTAEQVEIENWCHLTATTNREHAQPINDTAALWITDKEITLTIQCTNKPTHVHTITNTQIINLDSQCKASSARLTFIPTQITSNQSEIILKSFNLTFSGYHNWGVTSWNLQQPTIISNRFAEIHEALNSKVHLIPVWIAVTLAIIAIIIVILFILWLYIKAKQIPVTCKTDNTPNPNE